MWILGLKGLSRCFKEKFDIVTARSKRVLTVACSFVVLGEFRSTQITKERQSASKNVPGLILISFFQGTFLCEALKL